MRPTLLTERLRLEPLTAEHLEDLVALDADPEVLRFVLGRALSRDEVVETWLPRRTDPAHDARGLGYWVGRIAGTGAFAGWWFVTPDPADPGRGELGYRLPRDIWGRGYATEGCRAVLTHAFDSVGLHRVWASPAAANLASQHVLSKLGFRAAESAGPDSDDLDSDDLVYEITATDPRPWDEPGPGMRY